MPRPVFSVSIEAGASTIEYEGAPVVQETPRAIRTASELPSGPPRRRKPRGFIPPEPYSLQRDFADYGHGELKFDVYSMYTGVKVGTFRSYGNNNAIRYGFPHPANAVYNAFNGTSELSPSQAMIDKALVKARLGMKRSDVNLGVAFAERNKTAQLVGDTAVKLAQAIRHLRKGQWQNAWRDLGLQPARKAPKGSTIPQKWLEYQYGWKPLLSDVFGSVDALARRPPGDWRVTSKGSDRVDLSREVVHYPGGTPGALGSHRLLAKGWKGVMVRIDAVPENDLLVVLSQLGITNPLTVGWELVPFSFVLDWFLPIGSFLDSLDAMIGYRPDPYCSISSFSTVEVVGSGIPFEDVNFPYRNVGSWNGQWTVKRLRLNRDVRRDVPLPSLPRFKDPRSLSHMANGLSLLAGAVGRK